MKRLSGIVLALLFGGCASVHMQSTEIGQSDTVLSENQSAVVFFRDSILGAANQAPIVEATDTGPEFVGIVSSKTKILHKTTPGKHAFVVGGESGHMLDANLAPRKFYYVRVVPRLGLLKARFGLEPIQGNERQFERALSGCKWRTPGPSAKAWFLENKASMEEKCKLAAEDEDKSVLNPEDGFDRLLQ